MVGTQALAGARVLVVDDDPVFRVFFGDLLRDLGHEPLEAGDGEEGLRLLRGQSPDLVLLDLRMPRMDGLAVLDSITAEFPGLPVIVVSGTQDIRDAVGALRRGAWDYLVKPIRDPDLLGHVLGKALAHSRVLKENWRYHERLEEEVRTKTRELTEANTRLIAEKAQVEAMNLTLRNVLNAVEQEKRAIAGGVRGRVESRILPILERLARDEMGGTREGYLAVLRDELARLAAPDQGPEPALYDLTPTEMEVCRYLQLGRSTKEIAELMNSSFDTVQTHRKNIRKKLGIKGEKVSLITYLQARGRETARP